MSFAKPGTPQFEALLRWTKRLQACRTEEELRAFGRDVELNGSDLNEYDRASLAGAAAQVLFDSDRDSEPLEGLEDDDPRILRPDTPTVTWEP